MAFKKNDKQSLHPRNKHRKRYNFNELINTCPELAPFVKANPYGDLSIDFFDPLAVKILNKALLKQHYQIDYWDIPPHYLCPPIPGRADYMHHIADLLAQSNKDKIPTGKHIKLWDVGVGANCIYPILGTREYGWSFIGSDIDARSLASAKKIVDANTGLNQKIELRLQKNAAYIFKDIVKKGELLELVVCNPPFHTTQAEAEQGTRRKLRNLNAKPSAKPSLNFGGQAGELWCEGGEKQFIQQIIRESQTMATSCLWFSSLVAKEVHLKPIYALLQQAKVKDVKTILMAQGNKVSRLVAWTFLSQKQQEAWAKFRFKNS